MLYLHAAVDRKWKSQICRMKIPPWGFLSLYLKTITNSIVSSYYLLPPFLASFHLTATPLFSRLVNCILFPFSRKHREREGRMRDSDRSEMLFVCWYFCHWWWGREIKIWLWKSRTFWRFCNLSVGFSSIQSFSEVKHWPGSKLGCLNSS